MSVEAISELPAEVRYGYAEAFTSSIAVLFLVAAFVALIGFALTWLVPEQPLRETVAASSGDVGQDVARAVVMPVGTEPMEELVRGLAAVVRKILEESADRGSLSGVGVE